VATIAGVIIGFGVLGAAVTSWMVRRSAKLTVLVRDESGDRRTAGIFIDGSRRCDFSPCVVEEPAGEHIVTVAVEGAAPMMQSATFRAGDDATMTFVLPPPALPPPIPAAPASTASAAAAPSSAPAVSAAASASTAPATAGAAPVAVSPAPVAAAPVVRPRPFAQTPVAPPRDIARPAAAGGGPCKLQFNSIPVAEVNLDGAPIGETPRMNVSAQPGEHRVVFAAGDVRKTVVFRCGDGEEKTIAVRVQ